MSNKQHIFHNMTAYEHQTFGMKWNENQMPWKQTVQGLKKINHVFQSLAASG